MKCLIISYIKSQNNLSIVENVLAYYGFSVMESNISFKVFAGNPPTSIESFPRKLNTELSDLLFDVEDSICLVTTNNNKQSALSVIVIKRKGNKYLRNQAFSGD
jgi:hypothetical protein